MMFVFKDISLDPSVVESAGQSNKSTPSQSVPINLEQLCNPAFTRPQADSTSGIYARAHALSSMRCQRIQGFTETRKASRQISLRRSQIAPKVLCAAHPLCISFPRSPEARPQRTAAFFSR